MSRKVVSMTICCMAGLLLAGSSSAQNTNKFTFNIGAGFTEPVRNYGRLDTGFNFTAAGVRKSYALSRGAGRIRL